jgi:uncharacterized protein (UPF0548 family)
MFLSHRPSPAVIGRFIEESQRLPLSYPQVGIASKAPPDYDADETSVVIGSGEAGFERARTAIASWKHFELGWAEVHPRGASIDIGTTVAVLVQHLGFWSLNGCRVVYGLGDRSRGSTFGFAYGTLPNHAEQGEEIFEVSLDHAAQTVTYRIRAASRPRAALARLGYPLTRSLQARFRRDSGEALRRAMARYGL